jgi:hypothetical protein
MEACTGIVLFLSKGLSQLKQDVDGLAADDSKMRDFLQETIVKVQETLDAYNVLLGEFQSDVLYFGENTKDDIVGFFNNWKKFAHSYRVCRMVGDYKCCAHDGGHPR